MESSNYALGGRRTNRLFDISAEFAELFEQLDSLTEQADAMGIPREEVETAWFDTLDGMEQEFNLKAENVALYVKELNVKADALKQEEKKLSERRKAYERRAASLKDYLMHNMMQMHQKKVDGVRARITIRNNPASLQIQDESAVIQLLEQNGQDNLLKYAKPELRKTEIKSFLQSGGQLEGCSLITTQSILIK